MTNSPAFGTEPLGRFFIKMHGLRNHFIILDGRQHRYRPSKEETIQLCNPQTGVGGDQLIVIEPPSDKGALAGAFAFMRILNVDGREVEACGNATRCVAWLLLEECGTDQLALETLAGVIQCQRVGDQLVSCAMGRVSTEWQDIPLAEMRDTLQLDLDIPQLGLAVALNIGNPHVVFFVDDIAAIDVADIAPGIQENPLFPHEVNVGVVQLLSEKQMKLTVYERGAGLTTACGSGACVAVFAARLRGLTSQNNMTVTMFAGDVSVEIQDNEVAVMTGPVEYCYQGYL